MKVGDIVLVDPRMGKLRIGRVDRIVTITNERSNVLVEIFPTNWEYQRYTNQDTATYGRAYITDEQWFSEESIRVVGYETNLNDFMTDERWLAREMGN